MTVRKLRSILGDLEQDKQIVIQRNVREGFMLCEVDIWPTGHVGFNGPIIILGKQICFDVEVGPVDKSRSKSE